VATKKRRQKRAARLKPAGEVVTSPKPVQCVNCGYYAGSGNIGDACPTCKQPLYIASPS